MLCSGLRPGKRHSFDAVVARSTARPSKVAPWQEIKLHPSKRCHPVPVAPDQPAANDLSGNAESVELGLEPPVNVVEPLRALDRG
jgi:hypothetical protein